MGKRSAKAGAKGDIKFGKLDLPPPHVALEKNKMCSDVELVSISLKYYRDKAECFSKWSINDLSKFTAVIVKVRRQNSTEFRNNTTLCERHRYRPEADRYVRPTDLSSELDMVEIRVDSGSKARIYGVFVGSVFYLVWLDRNHEVFPQ